MASMRFPQAVMVKISAVVPIIVKIRLNFFLTATSIL